MKSWIEISSARLAENFRAIQAVAGQGVEALAVIKANAYGHGTTICAPVLAEAGAQWLGVSDVAEGEAVRTALPHSGIRVLVMCGMELADAPALVAHGLTPVVWTPEHIAALERAARSAGHRIQVHLEVDTGMGRQGAAPGEDLARTLEALADSRWVSCEGIMTHLCCSESAEAKITEEQRERFASALDQALAAGMRPEFVHLANTSAVDEGSTMQWIRDTAKSLGARAMVRIGFAIYGHCLEIEGEHAHAGALAPKVSPVLVWKTRIIGLRGVAAGATVGYGATFVATQPMRLALLPVGYADGYRRAASSGVGNGWVMIAGRRAPVVGRVSMNLTVVDVSGHADVQEGMEAVLLGEGVTAEDQARWSGTIAYDILCGIRANFELR
ncbi:alanine racemase [Granulicella mallensis]|uniref:Alanine racemase n=1 Tax=Granulicella mallensis (strain ATCC BAA-1857 / DSM 23137 / MP5ACTX8) TaxID=682795 RepID=G8NU73_GRAMM|nr:alanine racemase [Granulicella mallensis]AEU38708.1 Alanine racemase [Granulicella mallensis MP5ACTX8]